MFEVNNIRQLWGLEGKWVLIVPLGLNKENGILAQVTGVLRGHRTAVNVNLKDGFSAHIDDDFIGRVYKVYAIDEENYPEYFI